MFSTSPSITPISTRRRLAGLAVEGLALALLYWLAFLASSPSFEALQTFIASLTEGSHPFVQSRDAANTSYFSAESLLHMFQYQREVWFFFFIFATLYFLVTHLFFNTSLGGLVCGYRLRHAHTGQYLTVTQAAARITVILAPFMTLIAFHLWVIYEAAMQAIHSAEMLEAGNRIHALSAEALSQQNYLDFMANIYPILMVVMGTFCAVSVFLPLLDSEKRCLGDKLADSVLSREPV